MKQPAVNAGRLAQKICAAIDRKGLTLEQAAANAGIEASRVSRFRAGQFRRVTPTLEKLCRSMGVSWKDCLFEKGLSKLPEDFLESVRRLVGRSPRRIRAVRQLVRSVELLVEERG